MDYKKAVHQRFVGFEKVRGLFRRVFFYNILIEYGIPTNFLRLIEMCLNETYSRVRDTCLILF